MTSGTSTSEFKVTLLSQFIGMALVSLGIVDPLDSEAITEHLLVIMGALSAMVTSLLYIYSRMRLKDKSMQLEGLESLKDIVAKSKVVAG